MASLLARGLLPALFGASLAMASAAASSDAEAGPTLDAVKARGALVCAMNGSRPGFSVVDSKGEWTGLEVDVCRAIAAAVLGDAGKVQYVKSTTQTRLTVLQTGEVDVTLSNVTWTYGRDADLGLDFITPTFYDGQGFMVPKKLGVKSVKELDGATICVRPGSTSERIIADAQAKYSIKITLVVIEDQKELNTAFFGGRCDVFVQTTSGLSAIRAAVAPNPEDFVILPEVFGKDPMGPVVRQGDPQWRDIVQWTVFALFEAEERGITSKNVDQMRRDSKEAEVQRLLGTAGGSSGKGLGLDPEWAYRVIKQVGNYAEIYDRSLGDGSKLKLSRGVNQQWTNGGLLYAPPF
ncbi:amino acid ABC transporter substrate-binding protein (PAAT family) [Stella humosa]|uniref:Amino acid ABC transporter substrate-binding protein (PAAT family) n=1 Tax=Stella humosa TaxID=94 RepID=A0A3N1KY54_9PROT|nr:amino acid ABC transporter substrate-binding protein [Stella humosa]ROP84362.1 amino acid ABC transporter substrate-binding protein (PAAT family) [Stella humosa]BBK33877.1 ABC transporter substrate-binding protein [Stella humosa]